MAVAASNLDSNLDSLINVLNSKLLAAQKRPFNSTEVLILRGIWQYKTYNKMALEADYSPAYFTNVVAPELFRRLSEIIGQRISKKNCRITLESYLKKQITTDDREQPRDYLGNNNKNSNLPPQYPNGSVPIDSAYYVKRDPYEEQAYEEIKKPGALIRIKAPQEMGKTSMLSRILGYASRQEYRTVSLNFQQIDETILNNTNRFLRWLCANVSYQLKLESKLNDYWDEDIGGKISSTLYFQYYILEQIEEPLVLALDEVNCIFEHPQVAKDILPLFRSWYEEAKRYPLWRKLRLIVVHSTEIYVPLKLKQSPFNVGLPIQLDNLSFEQVKELGQCYGIQWQDDNQIKQLMELIGGHPALTSITFYYLNRGETTFEQLLETATNTTGIYNYHLQRHWVNLEEQPDLLTAFNSVIKSTEPVSLEPIMAYKLSSMGLIKQIGNQAIPVCELYRQSFLQE
ncbi:MAG: AAA-like domain-containing protein [Cyanobacteria bacterium P01_A01_bin.83]